MTTIAVINQKGGVGKTATAYNLAYAFSLLQNTLLIDFDPSANATKGFSFLVTDPVKTSYGLITEKLPLNNYASQVYPDNQKLFLIPSHIRLALAQREIMGKAFRETLLDKKLKDKGNLLTIVDCSPTLNDLTINALYASDFILIPISYEVDALEGMSDLFKIINEIKESQRFQFRIILNKRDSRKTKTNALIESQLLSPIIQPALLKTIIRQDESINQAKIAGKPIFQFAPDSNGANDYQALTYELKGIIK